MRQGRDGLFTTLATAGLALATAGFVTSGRLAWVLRLVGLALTAVAVAGLAWAVLRQRSK